MKKWVPLLCLVFLAIIGSFYLSQSKKESSIEQSKKDLKNQIPIILLHGSGGDEYSFSPFSEELIQKEDSSSEVLPVTINEDGLLDYQGSLNSDTNRPLISLGFTENNAPIEDWSAWLKILMIDLKKHYGFKQADIVGYSNGGLAATYYAETIGHDTDVPTLRRLVLIGAPFNDLDEEENAGNANFEELVDQSPELENYLAIKQHLSKDLAVLSIAGDDETETYTDGIVPLRSALSSRFIFPEYVHTYFEKITTEGPSDHLSLLSNQQVIDWTYWFLFDYKLAKEREIIFASQ